MENKWENCPGWENVYINDGKPEASLLKLSCDRANILLKWYPVLSFHETVEFTTNWYLNFYNKKSNIFKYTINQIRTYSLKAKDKQILWSLK